MWLEGAEVHWDQWCYRHNQNCWWDHLDVSLNLKRGSFDLMRLYIDSEDFLKWEKGTQKSYERVVVAAVEDEVRNGD